MTWYALDGIMEGLIRRGFVPVATNDPGVMLLKGSKGVQHFHPRVPLPMNIGDWIPGTTVRKLLSEVEFDVDAFLQEIPTKNG